MPLASGVESRRSREGSVPVRVQRGFLRAPRPSVSLRQTMPVLGGPVGVLPEIGELAFGVIAPPPPGLLKFGEVHLPPLRPSMQFVHQLR